MLSVPVTGYGYADASERVSGICVAGATLPVTPLNVNAVSGGPMASVKLPVAMAPVPSVTRRVRLADAVVEDVPWIIPSDVRMIPAGRLPLAIDHV
jgi:hypothetical protein